MAAVLPVQVEPVTVDEGFWCRPCKLPSGARLWFTVTIGLRMVLHSRLECRDCGGSDVDGAA